ncbi:hypothetical protein [Halomonas organivorans]|uniref:Uncharacterized protein n=1 Tax=Halomonas organivorans TaxID=257772 RepID=A0A7W5BY44_9GAMM|nr:hypothetical protein [Halomonas organivorans]MBB3141240.1 hypothetical protein [Halomonas organivorans]
MYQDPNLVRQRYASVNLNDRERTLLDALVYHSGQPRSVLLREMLLKEAYDRLGVGRLYNANLARGAQ